MYLTVPTAVSTASVFSIGLECATGTCSHSHSHSRSRAQRYPNISLLPRSSRADVLRAPRRIAASPLAPRPSPLAPRYCRCYVTRRRETPRRPFIFPACRKACPPRIRPLNRIALTRIGRSEEHFRQHPRETGSTLGIIMTIIMTTMSDSKEEATRG